MKKLLACIILGSSLLACQEDKDAQLSAAQFEVTKQKTASVTVANTEQVQVTLKQVTDSRCPTGAQCIWAGNVQTTIEVKSAADSAQTVGLCLAQCEIGKPWKNRDSTTVLINKKPYWLCLTAVNPYPSVNNSNQAQTAALRLVPQ